MCAAYKTRRSVGIKPKEKLLDRMLSEAGENQWLLVGLKRYCSLLPFRASVFPFQLIRLAEETLDF